ncbi:MAG TPA: hypothetical protein VK737_10120 [Opitutales bacterium]|nr:hypothetical protein [Opitutales bacterium]
MRPFSRLYLALTAIVLAAGLCSGCSDSLVSDRSDEHVPSVAPAPWEGNSMNLPTPDQNH